MPDDSILSLPPVAADHRLHYGADPNQFADLFLPKTPGPHPVVMNIHGGYWRARYDLTHASRFCRALADHGLAVFSLEYRRVGDAQSHHESHDRTTAGQGGWPATYEDILAGWQSLARFAPQHHLDLGRAAVTGHSAGGQLALALAHRADRLTPKPRLAVSLAGVLDLQRAYDLHLSNNAVVEFLGGTPAQVPEHYAEADPIRLAVPIPQHLFHGVPDDAVPVALSRDYFHRKQTQRESIQYTESPTAGHFEWIDPRTQEFLQVRDAVERAVNA